MQSVCLHEHDILSILFCPANVSGRGSFFSHTVLTCTADLTARISLARRQPPPGRSGLELGQVWVGGDFGSATG